MIMLNCFLKNSRIFILIFSFIGITFFASSQTSKETKLLVERSWKGKTVTKSSSVEIGDVTLEQVLDLIVLYDNVVRGTVISTYSYNGKKYKSTARLSGYYNPGKAELFLSVDGYNSQDALPNNWRWCKSRGTLKLLKSSSKYSLKGKMEDDCGGKANASFEG
jgi:hypothetical protein